MSLSTAGVWEVRTTGDDTNGGGFKSGASGTDYSQQDAKNTVGNNISTTDAVANGTTTITSALGTFTSGIVGNFVYFQGGTGAIAAQWREVTVFTNATTITIDAIIAASTGMTMNIGGALLSPSIAAATKVAGNDVWIKSGTYSITSASADVAGGRVLEDTGGVDQTNMSRWEGYQTTRGDRAARPILQVSGAIGTFTVFTLGITYINIINIEVDGAAKTALRGFDTSQSYCRAILCKASNCTNSGFYYNNGNNVSWWRCQATGCSTIAAFKADSTGILVLDCEATGNTIHGFSAHHSSAYIRCISASNTGASTDGFAGSSVGDRFIDCVSYGNGRAGFDLAGNTGIGALLENCIAEGNGGEGYRTDGVKQNAYLNRCAGYNNTSGNYNTSNLLAVNVESFVAGTASFFVDAANGNFALNTTSGGGASARAAGYPGLMPRGLSTGYHDIGPIQHADPGGGGLLTNPGMAGGMRG